MGSLIGIKADDYRVRTAAERQKAELVERVSPSLN
jgi:hypothetical protein